MSNKKIVITGASGFLGSHLVERLKEATSYEVYALSSKPGQLKERIGGENIEYVHKDALDAEMLKESIVVNCAYPRNSTGTGTADGLKYIQRVFEAAVEGEASAIINISSQSVYSQQRIEAATEETPVCLESPYAVGKYAVELMLESICKGRGTAYANIRMASLIGPGFDQRIVNRFIKQALEGGSIKAVLSDQKFGFLDVEDAAESIVNLLNSPMKTWRTTYNVGNNIGYTIEDILLSIKEAFNDRELEMPEIVYETGTAYGSTIVNYSELNADTGFEPKKNLRNSVERIINDMQRNSH